MASSSAATKAGSTALSRSDAKATGAENILSVDAMGGDRGASAVVAGMAKYAAKNPEQHFIVHGDEPTLKKLLRRRVSLNGRVEIRHCPDIVTMDDKPSKVLRKARGTSMMGAVETVAAGEASAAVSCGNTGALMALSMLKLRRAPGVDRPAIAVLWPSRNPAGYNVVLDVGADVRAEPESLLQFAIMGAAYARTALGLSRPRVGLLNVGSEAHKGGAELRRAAELIANAAVREEAGFSYTGFVEGSDIVSDEVDVIVTDGFTGNIALKTAEGTAGLINDFMRKALSRNFFAKLGAMVVYPSLRWLKLRIDPRRVNGGVFLGLNGSVVKSHGSADATGVEAAIRLAADMGRSSFPQRVAERVANALAPVDASAATNVEEWKKKS